MTDKNVELKCPECGSEDIVEWSNVDASQDVLKVVKKDDGEYEVGDWGISKPYWDISESQGFACSKFCEGECFPLEHYVVK